MNKSGNTPPFVAMTRVLRMQRSGKFAEGGKLV